MVTWRVSTTLLHYLTAFIKGIAVFLLPGFESLELSSEQNRRGKKTIRRLYQFDWYKELIQQYKHNCDHHPAVLDFASYVNVDLLHTVEGKEKFIKNFKILLDSLNSK